METKTGVAYYQGSAALLDERMIPEVYKTCSGSQEIAQWPKFLFQKHEDLISHPQHPCKNLIIAQRAAKDGLTVSLVN